MAFKHIFTLAAFCALGVTTSTAATEATARTLTLRERGAIQNMLAKFSFEPDLQKQIDFIIDPYRTTSDPGFTEAVHKLFDHAVKLASAEPGDCPLLNNGLEALTDLRGGNDGAYALVLINGASRELRWETTQTRFAQRMAALGS